MNGSPENEGEDQDVSEVLGECSPGKGGGVLFTAEWKLAFLLIPRLLPQGRLGQ